MAYCLGTNTIVFCLRGKSAKAMNRLRTASASDVRVPMQVLAELRLGAAKSAKPIQNRQLVDAFVKPYAVLWPDDHIIEQYISIRCSLEAIGRNIGEADLWIAATARANNDVIVTNNTDEFARVPGLVVEDWSV
ncbi:MAG: type II toxin-antitoxin system VapC family toxin [Prosthecobacter sp.]|uniref:type II toxin-antitoxin system VapC family toxin n=1 Tax=Prosthecobacter sp. TaxID=1965333 RepID=UPI0025D21FF1|nr:type II toxin-antitoxin system VapC family toxin [Prosthecobacter sp.]MCF7785525.1 type II toxin-antitoxin system VapC family toxin [Prosthecobacter sp.]